MNREKITWDFFWQHIYHHVTGNINEPSLLDANHLDVKRLYQLIHEHRLDLIFLPLLNNYEFSKMTGSYPFKLRCMKKRYRFQQMKACLLDITSIFDRQHIPFIVLKGIPLNNQLYNDACLRTSNDIDLLIHENDLLAAHTALLSVGFGLKFELTLEQLISKADLMKVIKDLSYINPTKNFRIELHWHTAEIPALNIQPFHKQHMIRQALSSEKSVNVLDHETNFLYLCTHAAFHNWQRLQWFIDIIVFYQEIPLDWSRLIALAQQYNAIRPLLEAKKLMSDAFGLELPHIPSKLSDSLVTKFRLQHAKKLWQIHRLRPYIEVSYLVFLSSSSKVKWHYLLGLLLKGKTCLQQLVLDPQCSNRKLIFLNVRRKIRLLIQNGMLFLKTRRLFVR